MTVTARFSADDIVPPRDALMRGMERIYRYRMTTTSGGNLSLRDADGSIWITPAGVDKGSLRSDDIVRVDPTGAVVGRHRASSEFPFHRAIYEARRDLGGIVHAHPVALVAFSIARRVPDTRLLPQARVVCGRVGFAPYALPGSEALGSNIAQAFAEGYDCVILENHGVVVGGTDLQQAFERFETLEFCARTVLEATRLGPVRYLDDAEVARPAPALDFETFTRNCPITSQEKELRAQLAEFVRRSYQQRLMISTQGAFSARLDAESFLVTPHRVDRSTLAPEAMALVRGGRVEEGWRPSSSARGHQAIYVAHPEARAVVNAYPVHATAFSVTDAAFDSRTIPESYIVLRDVARAPLGVRHGDGRALAELLTPRRPALILQNDGVQVCGRSILDAFDRLEVLESTAEAMLESRLLGPMTPMTDAALAELRRAFSMD